MYMSWMPTLLPGFGPLFFGILRGSAWVWACCRAILWAQLAGSLPLVRPGPVTGRPGPAMASSSQPALFAQPNCKPSTKERQSQKRLPLCAVRLHNDIAPSMRKQDVAQGPKCLHASKAATVEQLECCLLTKWILLLKGCLMLYNFI